MFLIFPAEIQTEADLHHAKWRLTAKKKPQNRTVCFQKKQASVSANEKQERWPDVAPQ